MSISYFFMQNADANIIYCNLFDTQGTPLRCSNHEHRRAVRAPHSFEQFAHFEERRSSGHLPPVPFRPPISRPFNHKIAFHMHEIGAGFGVKSQSLMVSRMQRVSTRFRENHTRA